MRSGWPVRAENLPGIFCAWRGPSLLILDREGRASPDMVAGFFFRETRYLSRFELLINDERPFACSVAQVEANRLEYTYIYPTVDVGAGGGSGSGGQERHGGILQRGVDIRQVLIVHPSSIEVILEIVNRWDEWAEVSLAWQFDADFCDVPEAQSGRRSQQAQVEREPLESGLRFRYLHQRLPFMTEIVGDRLEASGDCLIARLTLGRQQPATVRLHITAIDYSDPVSVSEGAIRDGRVERWFKDACIITSTADGITEIVNRGIRDLGSFALLDGMSDEWLTPAAGVPLYLSLWGRDALTAAWQGALFDQGQMAESSVNRIGRLQGQAVNPAIDEEPGRIIQQTRTGPLERLGESPFSRYYADQASPFDYIFALAHAYACSGKHELIQRHWDTLRRIMDWAREYGDADGDGYLEYQTRALKGPRHQGWKDSDNAMVYEDGHQADPPLSACEVQGYYFASLQIMAVLSLLMKEAGNAAAYWRASKELRERFNRDFWIESEGFLALALDADKQQVRSVTSNGGQTLATGICSAEHMPRLVRRLFEPDMFSGWGIRTLSSRNPSYNPLDYHLGSVWLVENSTIVFGLRRFGFDREALRLARSLFDLAYLWPGFRVPECIGGYSKDELAHPGAYPRANAPQMWNQSAWPLIVQSILGLQPMAPLETLAVDPALPEWLPDVTIHRLRIGAATVTVRFWRNSSGESEFEVLKLEGALRVLRQPSPNSLKAGIWDRLASALNLA